MSTFQNIILCLVPVITLLSACATQAPDRGGDSLFLGVTTSKGKATPHGRSDTADAYFPLDVTADDPSYGYSPDNPIRVGGIQQGPSRERMYLNALMGPNGEPIEYERIGSCCPFSTPNGFKGGGLLDAFRVTYEGHASPITLYINFYDESPLRIPDGFTARGGN